MQFIDLKTQYTLLKEQINSNIQTVLEHGQYILGPEIETLEKQLADFCGAKYALSCASGTDALVLAYLALGVKPNDVIFTTPFTFFATAETIAILGAVPVFVDIDPRTFNMDPAKLALAIEAVEKNDPSIYPLPKTDKALNPFAIVPVDLFGLAADYEPILALAKKHNLKVIEDTAQGFGAKYNNQTCGSFGDIACTSFFPAKPLGCYGDGGMCFTSDDKLIEILRSLRVHGQGIDKYNNTRIGINGRMDTLQAAIMLPKVAIFPEEIEKRQCIAEIYTKNFNTCKELTTPLIPENCTSIWAQYSLLAENSSKRAHIMSALQKEDIPSVIYYQKPLQMQEAFSDLAYKAEDFPVSNDLKDRIFSLPMHAYLKESEQKKIIEIVKNNL